MDSRIAFVAFCILIESLILTAVDKRITLAKKGVRFPGVALVRAALNRLIAFTFEVLRIFIIFTAMRCTITDAL